MSYPNELLHKYIEYIIDPGATMTTRLKNKIDDDGLLPDQITRAQVKVKNQMGPESGSHRIPKWNFSFLKYIAGAVTFAPIGKGVLTGPMSGCWLFTYRYRKQLTLAHVGTANSKTSKDTRTAKAAWFQYSTKINDECSIVGYQPSDYFTDDERIQLAYENFAPQTFGYFLSDLEAYAILLAPVRITNKGNSSFPDLYQVANVVQMNALSWGEIATEPTWQ